MTIISLSQHELEGTRYTAAGIARLKLAIRATLQKNRWSARELARKAGISHGTVHKYANGHISEPQPKTLEALAPYIFKVVSFPSDLITIDTEHTYGSDWRELERIATSAFDREQEVYQQASSSEMEKLAQLILDEIRRQDIDLEQFTREALLSPSDIKDILQGIILSDDIYKLGLLATRLRNPETGQTFSSWEELALYCGLAKTKNPA